MSRLFGWCGTDQHNLCRVEFTDQLGVRVECACPCHQENE